MIIAFALYALFVMGMGALAWLRLIKCRKELTRARESANLGWTALRNLRAEQHQPLRDRIRDLDMEAAEWACRCGKLGAECQALRAQVAELEAETDWERAIRRRAVHTPPVAGDPP